MKRRSLLLGAAASALSAGASQAFGLNFGLGHMGGRGGGNGGTPSWVPSGGAISQDFANSRYFGGTLANLNTLTRAAPAVTYAENSGGVLVAFAANIPRITDLGVLLEGTRTGVVLHNRDLRITHQLTVTGGAGTFTSGETVTATGGGTGAYIAGESTSTIFGLAGGSGTFTGTLTGGTSGATKTISASAAVWTRSNVNVALDQTGADGVAASASSITVVADGAWSISQAITLGSSARFLSLYGKRGVGSSTFRMSMDNNSTSTLQTVTPAMTRLLNPTQTLANPTIVISGVGVAGDTFTIDFVQNENGTFATSPIPTTTVAVTRSADVLIGAGAQLTLAKTLTFTCVIKTYLQNVSSTVNQTFLTVDDGTNNNRLYIRRQGATGAPHAILASGGSLNINADYSSGSIVTLTPQKTGFAIAAGDQKGAFGGTRDTNSYASALPVSPTTLRIGAAIAGEEIQGYIQQITWWNTRLPDATLEALTGPKLPSLPLAAGAKVMAFGHSMVQRAYAVNGGGSNPITLVRSLRRGVFPWIKALDQRFNMDSWGDPNAPSWLLPANLNMINGSSQGENGDALEYQSALTPGTLSKTPYMLARKPDLIYFDIGQNDYAYLLRDVPTVRAEYQANLDLFLDAGVHTVGSTVYPIFGFAPGTAVDNNRLAHNAWLRSLSGVRAGFTVADADTVLGTSVNPTYQDSASAGHLTDLGAYPIAKDLVLPILQAMVSSGNYYDTDWTVNNIFPTATRGMLGTSGTSNGTVATGGIATGFFASRGAGQASTITATKEVIDVSREKQVFTIAPSADGTPIHTGNFRLQSSPSMASLSLAVGDWVQLLWRLELSAWAYWNDFFTICGADTSGASTIQSWAMGVGTLPETTDALDIYAICEPFQIPAGSNNISFGTPMLNYSWQSAATGSGVIKISPPIFRKVTDPRTAWVL